MFETLKRYVKGDEWGEPIEMPIKRMAHMGKDRY